MSKYKIADYGNGVHVYLGSYDIGAGCGFTYKSWDGLEVSVVKEHVQIGYGKQESVLYSFRIEFDGASRAFPEVQDPVEAFRKYTEICVTAAKDAAAAYSRRAVAVIAVLNDYSGNKVV